MSRPNAVQATPIDQLIRAMAEFAVQEYLTEQSAPARGNGAMRSNPVQLPDLVEAA